MSQTDVMGTGSGLDLAYYSLNGTPDHQPVPHRLLASSMGRSLDEAFVTSSYSDYREYSGEPLTARVTHHRTSSQPSRMVTAYRPVDNGQGNQPCGGSMMDFDGQPGGGMYALCAGITVFPRQIFPNSADQFAKFCGSPQQIFHM